MNRHTCIICGKKREEKYMISLPENISETLTTGKSWLCYRARNWRDKNHCIDSFIKSRQKILDLKQDNLNSFKMSVQE